MEDSLSILQYIKKKYSINNLEEIVSLFYLSMLFSIIIYLSMRFEVIQMAFMIFSVLNISMYLLNNYYKTKYNNQLEIINEKMKYITELVEKILITS